MVLAPKDIQEVEMILPKAMENMVSRNMMFSLMALKAHELRKSNEVVPTQGATTAVDGS
jgi:hypothetical protein